MVKKILIWRCRVCGVTAKSYTPQDEEKNPKSKRFFTCNDCMLKDLFKRGKIPGIQSSLLL